MNLYLITHDRKSNGVDIHDFSVVVAESASSAKRMRPHFPSCCELAIPRLVDAKLIGVACDSSNIGDIICASINAES